MLSHLRGFQWFDSWEMEPSLEYHELIPLLYLSHWYTDDDIIPMNQNCNGSLLQTGGNSDVLWESLHMHTQSHAT